VKYLITGGAGFIGSHLADRLVARGDEVYVIDDLSTGSKDNVAQLAGKSGFHATYDTILNRDLMLELVGTCDAVLHLAAAVGVKYIIDNPFESIKTNVEGTGLVFELANKFKKKVFLASTSEIYGKQSKSPLAEDDERILGPTTIARWSYSSTKALDEFLLMAYYKKYGLPFIVARFFNTVGPRQSAAYGMVLPRFVEQALAGGDITVFGTGEQTRTFVHVSDVAGAVLGLLDDGACEGQIFNIGGDEEVTMNDLARRVKKIAGSASKIVHVPYEKAYEKDFEDMERRVPDVSKIRKFIGFKPTLGLDAVIKDVVEFYRSGK